MKTAKKLIIVLALTPTLFFAQGNVDEVQLVEQVETEVFLQQNLSDFNAKFHSLFVASYKSFQGKEIDFESGINEAISTVEGKKTFSVTFKCNEIESIANAVKKDIVDRIMTVSPNGFVETIEQSDFAEVSSISFNPKYADKAMHQSTIKVSLNYNTLTVDIVITEPIKK